MIRPNPDATCAAADDAETSATSRIVTFRTGLLAEPKLADHGFHGMAVLPGAYLMGLAGKIHRDTFQREAAAIQRIAFERPILLSDDGTTISARITQKDGSGLHIEFFEAAPEALENSQELRPCASMQTLASAHGAPQVSATPSEETRGQELAADYYRRLRTNGNEYGPHFQVITSASRSGANFVATIAAGALLRDTATLDAAAQLLAAFAWENGRTFVLHSVGQLTFFTDKNPHPARAVASVAPESTDNGGDLLGSVVFTDADSTPLAEFSGVRLSYIDPPASPAKSPAPPFRLCVASTFTAEPVEDSLQFWARQFGRETAVEFAPYNQVFQQLLDPASAFRRNREGINILVLSLTDWLHQDRPTLPAVNAAHFGNRPRHVLPNGLEIAHLNRHETEYVYQEIFEDESYLRHGIELPDNATIIDIGANIGLFSLFVLSRCKTPTLYAFEPSPRTFDVLSANCAAYGGGRAHAFNCGVAEKRGSAEFTFYEHSSVFSSFHPDETEDRAAVEAVARNVLGNELRDLSAVDDADVSAITAHRLDAQKFECPLTSVSDIIRDHGITRIDLLKIDAEKSELGILRGIADEHWPLIGQLVIEVHDRTRAAVNAVEEMLTQRGFQCDIVEEKLLEQSGLFNIYARRPSSAAGESASAGLRSKVDEFRAALDTFAAASNNPLILASAPRQNTGSSALLNATEDEILASAGRHPHIHCISSREIVARYPVQRMHDAHSHRIGHMPFTPEGYAAIGTAISRAIFRVTAPQVKVIALDCDNTLWQGLCAEDGPEGVAITPPFKRLQEFMVAQSEAGLLLTLCSKNREEDVFSVFEKRGDMPLRREHLAGWRINWESKPENLRTLARQLNVGLDTFVFLDDNPVECASVRAACPEVVTLQLPSDPDRIPAFLDSLWILDRTAATSEDRARGEWYRANSGREDLRTSAPTLRDFLDSLQLRIETSEATEEQIPRVAQLTQRTNQFNLTAIRRSERELREFLDSGGKCLVTCVSDRFGDYGLVGAILHSSAEGQRVVDTMLLSCRALGKGVEHRMLAALGQRAIAAGEEAVQLPYVRTDRNEPARAFLSQLGSSPYTDAFTLTVSAASLASLRYEPASQPHAEAAKPESGAAATSVKHDHSTLSAAMQRLGEELTGITSVIAAMESARVQSHSSGEASAAESSGPPATLEQKLAEIWRKALGHSHIGTSENFFDAGGTSLKAVVVVAAIRRELNRSVSIITLFECPTIKLLAARLDGSDTHPASAAPDAADAESRGKQRRNKLIKRRTA